MTGRMRRARTAISNAGLIGLVRTRSIGMPCASCMTASTPQAVITIVAGTDRRSSLRSARRVWTPSIPNIFQSRITRSKGAPRCWACTTISSAEGPDPVVVKRTCQRAKISFCIFKAMGLSSTTRMRSARIAGQGRTASTSSGCPTARVRPKVKGLPRP